MRAQGLSSDSILWTDGPGNAIAYADVALGGRDKPWLAKSTFEEALGNSIRSGHRIPEAWSRAVRNRLDWLAEQEGK